MIEPDLTKLAAAVQQLLTEHGPMTEDELEDALAAAGQDVNYLDAVLDEELDLAAPLTDDRWVWLPALLDERTFTHRLTPAEVEHDLVTLFPDLAALSYYFPSGEECQLADGTEARAALLPYDAARVLDRGIPPDTIDPEGTLLLAPGTLAGLSLTAGALLGVRVTSAGVEMRAVTDPPADASAAARELVVALSNAGDRPEEMTPLALAACAADSALFRRPTAPLGDILGLADLVREGEWVFPAGFDIARWRGTQRQAEIAHRHRLSSDEARTVLVTLRLLDQVAEIWDAATSAFAEDADGVAASAERLAAIVSGIAPGVQERVGGPTVRDSLALLAEPAVAEAVLAEIAPESGAAAGALGLFSETLEPMLPRSARVAARWLRAHAYEAFGDVLEAESCLHGAESLSPSWAPVLADLARYASDRGDAARALSLLRRSGASPEEPLMQILERCQVQPRTGLGRNQPCWCGSGRKYKQCHLRSEQLVLAARVPWLYEKARGQLALRRWRSAIFDAAGARSQHTDEDDPYAFIRALADPFVADAVLFEGGAFEEFVETRGLLLPEDERLLAQQWLLVSRSVHEVTAVRPGEGIDVRDVRTGDIHLVAGRTASRSLRTGDLFCARIVPAGDTTQILGGIEPVALHQRDELIELLDSEPDSLELVTFLSRRFAPPVLQNTEGEPLVLCTATLRVSDPDALATELDDRYERQETDDEATWFEHVTTHGMERIRASLRLASAELTVEANSEPRFERVLAAVRELDPGAEVLAEKREPAADLRAVEKLAARSPGSGSGVLDPADPEVAAVLEQFTRQYEGSWLDEPIPALAGRTPRQCADDPTRRGDLVKLLDSFPETDGPGMMSPARLRAALGLG